jgi:hypothetical protein
VILVASCARSADLLDQVTLIAGSYVTANFAPSAQTFSVSTSGSYTIVLSDLQTPQALASVGVLVATSESAVATLNEPSSTTVSLESGQIYTVQPVAAAAGGSQGGALAVQVAPTGGGAAVWQYAWTVPAPTDNSAPGQSDLQTTFTVGTSGTYNLTVVDQAFPAALSSLQLDILPQGGLTSVPGTPISGPNISEALSLAAGQYQLFIVAKASSPGEAGLYSVSIQGPSGPAAYAMVVPVGQLPAPVSVNFPSSGAASLQLSDLATPSALSSLDVVVTQGSTLLVPKSGAGIYTFTASAGVAQMYALAQPGTGATQGAFEAYFQQGSTTVADQVVPVLAAGAYGYAFNVSLPSAGGYRVNINDYAVPLPFAGLTGLVVQDGRILASATGASSASFTGSAGPASVVVFPQLNGPSANSLLGVQVSTTSGSSPFFSVTQGVGALFTSQSVTVPTSGSFGLTLTDLGFPQSFGQIAVIATQGTDVVGEVIDHGQVTLSNLAAGTYTLNVLSEVSPSTNLGSFGLNLSPVPTVDFTVSPSSVTSGNSATLSWSSLNTNSCTASGAWSGPVATSGSQSTGALAAAASYTLTCSGDGGSVSQTVNVTIGSGGSASSGGGGGLTLLDLCLLIVFAALRSRRAQFAVIQKTLAERH